MAGRAAVGRRILTCDDESRILRALKLVLAPEGYEVLTAASMEEALDVAALPPVAAAIIDLILPDGNGVELCARLREWSTMPIMPAIGDRRSARRSRRCAPCAPEPTTT